MTPQPNTADNYYWRPFQTHPRRRELTFPKPVNTVPPRRRQAGPDRFPLPAYRPIAILPPPPPGISVTQQQKRYFRPHSPLLEYLDNKLPEEDIKRRPFLYMNTVMLWIKGIISREQLYDEKNPAMVLADPLLETALRVRLCNLSQLPEFVAAQLVSEDADNRQEPFTVDGYIPVHPILLERPAQYPTKPTSIHAREGLVPVNTPIALDTKFKVRPGFLKVLHSLPTVPEHQTVFEYQEISKILSQYILANKNKFFDYRNNKAVMCDGDILGDAFGVRSFHRSQVMTLLRLQLIPTTADEQRRRETRVTKRKRPQHSTETRQ